MANLARLRVAWGGSPVIGPGVTTLFFDEASSGFVADTVTLFTSLLSRLPAPMTLDVPNTGELIQDTTGDIVGTWTETGGATLTATNVTGHLDGVGGRITWETSARRNNRPVRGATFLVPLSMQQYSGAGEIDSAAVAAIQTAVSTFITARAGSMRVWSRPSAAGAGSSATVLSGIMHPEISWLRSRKT